MQPSYGPFGPNSPSVTAPSAVASRLLRRKLMMLERTQPAWNFWRARDVRSPVPDPKETPRPRRSAEVSAMSRATMSVESFTNWSGVGRTTAYKVMDDDLPYFYIGRKRYILVEDAEAWLLSRKNRFVKPRASKKTEV